MRPRWEVLGLAKFKLPVPIVDARWLLYMFEKPLDGPRYLLWDDHRLATL